MTNEERLQKLQLERQKIDEEIKTIKNSGRLCDYVSKMPIEYIRVRKDVPQYPHKHRDVWKHIADMSKCIFIKNKSPHDELFCPMTHRRFKEFSVEEMEVAAALADELVEVFNKHFKKYNPTVVHLGCTKRVIDNE